MKVKLFSQEILNGTVEQLQDELKNIAEMKTELLAKGWYEQTARLRDWEKKVIETIELKTKGENLSPTGEQEKAG